MEEISRHGMWLTRRHIPLPDGQNFIRPTRPTTVEGNIVGQSEQPEARKTNSLVENTVERAKFQTGLLNDRPT